MFSKKLLDYFNQDELAASIYLQKYALRNNADEVLEPTPTDMFRRISKEFARIQKNKYKNPLSEEEIFNLMEHFKYIIPQGSPLFGIGNDYQTISLANCFVVDPPKDSYGAILKTDEQIVQLCKRRGGVGTDLSNLRPSGHPTKNAAKTSTGVTAFMERYSNSINEVGQSGRRGALMLTLSCNHPDVEKFITIKNDRTKVTGANVSVRIDDKFMHAVLNDTDIELCFPVDWKEQGLEAPSMSATKKAKDIFNLLVENSWEHAEPGIAFWDTIIKNNPADCYEDFKSVSSNPCVVGDTLVGTNYGYVKIKNLEQLKKKYEDLKIITSDRNHNLAFSELEWVGITKTMDDIFEVEVENGQKIKCNRTHKFYLKDTYEQIEVQNVVENETEIYLYKSYQKIIKVTNLNYKEDVYDLTANPNYNFYTISGQEENILESPVDLSDLFKGVAPVLSVDCAEIFMSPLESCRLMVLNVFSYIENKYTKDAFFNVELFNNHVAILTRLLDDLIDLEAEKIDLIINKIQNSDPEPLNIKQNEIEIWVKIKDKLLRGRRVGLGLTGIGDAIAGLGYIYGDDFSLNFIDTIFRNLRNTSYLESIMLAKELGKFEGYDFEKEKDCEFIKRLHYDRPDIEEMHRKYGRRNIALLTQAPTGSISCLAGVSSGIEPVFRTSYIRRKKVNGPEDKVDFVDQNGIKFTEYKVYHTQLLNYLLEDPNRKEETSPWFNSTSDKINWINSVKLQGIAQKYIDHSISKTVNLPNDIPKEIIGEIFITAWRSGCKGITVYRDGSRSGILVTEDNNKNINFKTKNSGIRRPKILNADVHHIKINGEEYYVAIGLMDGQPYEIFIGSYILDKLGHSISIPNCIKTGKIQKLKRGVYELKSTNCNEDESYILSGYEDLGEIESLARMTSLSLRHKIDLAFIVQALEKNNGLINFSKAMARTLKKYIPKGTKISGENCPNCGGANLVRNDGCILCPDCGYSKCN